MLQIRCRKVIESVRRILGALRPSDVTTCCANRLTRAGSQADRKRLQSLIVQRCCLYFQGLTSGYFSLVHLAMETAPLSLIAKSL